MKARSLVGLNLRRLRVARGVTAEAVGLLVGCEPSYIGRIERGGENPSVDLLEAIATALGEHVVALFHPLPEGEALPPGLPPGRKPTQRG